MGACETVSSRGVSIGGLKAGMSGAVRFPEGWTRLSPEVMVQCLQSELCEESLLRELRWHVKEVRHVNISRTRLLRIPLLGRFLRDQHEINRLILISLEMSLELIDRIERETLRVSREAPLPDRRACQRAFRFAGRQRSRTRIALKQLRDDWEHGRHASRRLQSKAGQAHVNRRMDTALKGVCDITTALFDIMKLDSFQGVLAGGGSASGIDFAGLENHLEICRWHAREGASVLGKRDTLWKPVSLLFDWQVRLNRLQRIALEENTHLLVEVSALLSRVVESHARQNSEPACA